MQSTQRRQLIAAFLGGLLLLTGFAWRQRHERAQLRRVGVTTAGDTLWLDGSRRDSVYFGMRVQGVHTRVADWYTIEVQCAPRTLSRFDDARLTAFAPRIVDTACAMLRRPTQ